MKPDWNDGTQGLLRWCRAAAYGALLLLGACSSLLPEGPAPSTHYSLDLAPSAQARTPLSPAASQLVILVTPPRSTPGFDRARMVYVKQEHKIEYFAENQWVEAPHRMIAPLIVSSLERSGAFRAVLQAPSGAVGHVRLNTEVIRLQQEFLGSPSRSRFTLRARLVDDGTRTVIATREFEAVADAPTANPYGGVQAANQAVNQVLAELVAFCVENTRDIKVPPPPMAGK